MELQPIFLKLDGRPGLVVGAGAVALEKIVSLLKTGLRLRVVAPAARYEVRALAEEGQLTWVPRAFDPGDVAGNFVVIAATDDTAVNAEVYREATARGILVNSVDDIPHCDFFFGAVVGRGPLQIAISTGGESPALAQRLRREIDEQLPADLGSWVTELGKLRRDVLATQPRGTERKLLLHALAQRTICASPLCATRAMARAARSDTAGKVFLVGAGPGDPELLTVKALRLLQSADVVLHDDLVPDAILELANPAAQRVSVGKRCGAKSITQDEINALMAAHAGDGRTVVRLKSGDPLLFGRAAEEMAALTEAHVEFEIVPGVSAAFAAAAALGAPLTDRSRASAVVLSTAHRADAEGPLSLSEREHSTRVVYMPGRSLQALAAHWLAEGLPPELPCAIVARAGQPDQQMRCTTLAALGDAEPVPAPSVVVAGWVLRQSAEWVETSAAIAASTTL